MIALLTAPVQPLLLPAYATHPRRERVTALAQGHTLPTETGDLWLPEPETAELEGEGLYTYGNTRLKQIPRAERHRLMEAWRRLQDDQLLYLTGMRSSGDVARTYEGFERTLISIRTATTIASRKPNKIAEVHYDLSHRIDNQKRAQNIKDGAILSRRVQELTGRQIEADAPVFTQGSYQWELVRWMQVNDDYAIVIKLKHPAPNATWIASIPVLTKDEADRELERLFREYQREYDKQEKMRSNTPMAQNGLLFAQ